MEEALEKIKISASDSQTKFNKWIEQKIPQSARENFSQIFGCENENACKDRIDRFLTAYAFSCNTQNALKSPVFVSGQKNGTFGPIYPMEFRIRNCDPHGGPGKSTKTCHCHEGKIIILDNHQMSELGSRLNHGV